MTSILIAIKKEVRKLDFNKLHRAIQFASIAHDGQYRKKSNIPYISHPFSAAMFLCHYFNETNFSAQQKEDMVIATVLHDVWEDTEVTLDQIEKNFGQNVANYVKAASEKDKSLHWEERKKQKIEALKTANLDIKLIICADKVHNLLSIVEDKKTEGEAVWSRFNRGKEDQEWYYRSIYQSLVFGLDEVPSLFRELKSLIDECFITE